MAAFTASSNILVRMNSQYVKIDGSYTKFVRNYEASYSSILDVNNIPYVVSTQTPNLQPINTREPRIQ
jgi:flavorubredoxin